MNNFVIKRIYIENFKLIDDFLLDLDLSEYDLIMLDGPNGFGKTTLFDAIELVLTGSIYRIRTEDGRSTFGVDLLRKYINRDCIIKIEFQGRDGQLFTLMKRLKAAQRPQRYRHEDFFNFETFKLPQFNADEAQFEVINQNIINEIFDISDISRFFNLFYYIQQQENTHFLKQKSKERMEAISKLFDTKQEEEEMRKLSNLRNQVRQEITKINRELSDLSTKRQKLIDEVQGFSGDSYKPVFQKTLPHLEIPKPWDIEQPVVSTRDSRDAMINEIRLISDFVLHFDEFQKGKLNEQLEAALSQKDVMEDALVLALHFEDYEELRRLNEKTKRLKDLRIKLSQEKFTANPDAIKFDQIVGDIELPIDHKTISSTVENIISEQKLAGELSKLVRELNETRAQLQIRFYTLISKHPHVGDSYCPFCGQNWDENDRLIEAINEKQEHFASYYDGATSRIQESFDKLYTEHLQPILDYIDAYLIEPSNIVDAAFFDRINAAIDKRSRIEKFLVWCSENEIDIQRYLHPNKTIPNNLEERLNKIIQEIQSRRIQVENSYDVGGDKFAFFNSLYKESFGGIPEYVRSCSQEQLNLKVHYIEALYYSGNAEELAKLERMLAMAQLKADALVEKEVQLRKIIDEYDAAIKQHWNRIMKDIEIPFYIYSGKIIQYYQKGLGVFIKEAESGEAKSIKFVSDDMSDHDAINYFSSGQISALVISFTLALNKVYGNNGLGLILIDDPVQSMDEINMSSLTELLRNEFPHKQIILSTHEDEVSRYMRYKFQKYGKSTLQFNVKQEFNKERNV